MNRSVCDWVTQLNLSRCGGLAGYHGRNIFGIIDHALCFLWLFIAATAFVVVQTITRFAGCQQYIHTFFITPIHRDISNADLQSGDSATRCGILIKKSPKAIAAQDPREKLRHSGAFTTGAHILRRQCLVIPPGTCTNSW